MVPKLRFPKFIKNPEWSVYALKDFSNPITRRAGTKKYTLLSITSGVALVSQMEKFGREIAGGAYKNYIVIEQGDFAYNKSSTKQFPEGYIAKLNNYKNGAVPNSIFTCFRIADEEVCKIFIDYIFQSNYHGSWLRKFIAVGARSHGSLNIEDVHLWSLPIALPEFAEQQKIADCLTSLDDLIAAENKKLEAHRVYKKGLMQKLFPAEGETVPKWRFPEFRDSGEWALKKLGSFAKVLMCKRIHTHETSGDGDVPFYKIGTLGNQADAYIAQELFNLYREKYNYPKIGEVLLTCSGTVGKCLPYDGMDAYYQDSNIVWIDNPTLELSNEMLLYIMSNVNWAKLNSTTITRIYGDDLRDLMLKFPKSESEQQKIAGCLLSLDNQISAQTEKIETLKQHKKGLMQGLFPSAQEVTE